MTINSPNPNADLTQNRGIYLGVRIAEDGNHEPEINDRINKGRAAISKLNSILLDRDVTPKTKTHIYHAIVKKYN
jgi:hypothetical protein